MADGIQSAKGGAGFEEARRGFDLGDRFYDPAHHLF